MVRRGTDKRFCGLVAESYFAIRTEPKKEQLTGETIQMIREFIFKNLTAPTYREMVKRRDYGN